MEEGVSEFVGYQAGVVLDAFRSPNGSDVLHGRDNFRVNSYTLKGELYHMATENQVVRSGAPDSIFIELNQLPTKESHHCKFDDCYKSRRGYEDFCREHKSIGKIISGLVIIAFFFISLKSLFEVLVIIKDNKIKKVILLNIIQYFSWLQKCLQ